MTENIDDPNSAAADDASDRRVWTNEEDEAIKSMVSKYGTKSWALIAENLSREFSIAGRSGKQCRERWHNHLDPHINKTGWTEEEERIMSEAHKELGNKWSEIARRLPGRTDNHVKNHWYSFMRRNVRRLNREIGQHAANCTTAATVLPITLPTSYQPREPSEKKVKIKHPHELNSLPHQPAAITATASIPTASVNGLNPQQVAGTGVATAAEPTVVEGEKRLPSAMKSGKKKGVRKAVNLSELKRYFQAAEDAARELVLEEINETSVIPTGARADPNDGVFQLTTVGALPLKSPKRLVALALANNNPAFRERLKQKLEASGGIKNLNTNQQHFTYEGSVVDSMTGESANSDTEDQDDSNNLTLQEQHQQVIQGYGLPHGGVEDPTGQTVSFHDLSKIKKLSSSKKKELKVETGASYSSSPMIEANGETSQVIMVKPKGRGRPPKVKIEGEDGKKVKKEKKMTKKERLRLIAEGEFSESDVVPSKRQKRKKQSDEDEESVVSGSHSTGGSIIKRRRKGELQITVDGGLGPQNSGPLSNRSLGLGPLTSSSKFNLSSTGSSLGVLADMGPPEDTPRRSFRMRAGNLSSLSVSNLNNFSYMESPYPTDKNMFGDMFGMNMGVVGNLAAGVPGVDTPSNLMHLDPPLSKHMTVKGGDGTRFDFDEAVAAHFPSPRAGEQLKGSSPCRWSAGSATSMNSGIFSFHEAAYANQKRDSTGSLEAMAEAAALQQEGELQDPQQQSIYAKKYKRDAKRKDSKRDSTESELSAQSEGSAGIAALGLAAASDDCMDEMTSALFSPPINGPKTNMFSTRQAIGTGPSPATFHASVGSSIDVFDSSQQNVTEVDRTVRVPALALSSVEGNRGGGPMVSQGTQAMTDEDKAQSEQGGSNSSSGSSDNAATVTGVSDPGVGKKRPQSLEINDNDNTMMDGYPLDTPRLMTLALSHLQD